MDRSFVGIAVKANERRETAYVECYMFMIFSQAIHGYTSLSTITNFNVLSVIGLLSNPQPLNLLNSAKLFIADWI